MAYTNGLVSVLSASATIICTPGPGGCMVQNLGANAVTLGGPGVTLGNGVSLPGGMTQPVLVATGIKPLSVDADDRLYGIAVTSPSNVVFLVAS